MKTGKSFIIILLFCTIIGIVLYQTTVAPRILSSSTTSNSSKSLSSVEIAAICVILVVFIGFIIVSAQQGFIAIWYSICKTALTNSSDNNTNDENGKKALNQDKGTTIQQPFLNPADQFS